MQGSLISSAIVTYNNGMAVSDTCRSILENTKRYEPFLHIIDNASSDDTLQHLSSLEGLRLIRNGKNIGFGAAHNKMLNADMGKYHFVINPDITVSSDVISDIADFMEQHEDIAMLMPKILNSDGTEQHLPKERPTFKRLFLGRLAKFSKRFAKIRSEYTWADKPVTEVTDIDFCSGCFFCIRSEVFKALGGFDERYFMYLEDADLALAAKKFGRVVIAPQFSVTHTWERESAKSLKYLLIHIISSFKFLIKQRKAKK